MVMRLDGGWRLADAEPAREVHLREVDREELQDHAQGQGPSLLPISSSPTSLSMSLNLFYLVPLCRLDLGPSGGREDEAARVLDRGDGVGEGADGRGGYCCSFTQGTWPYSFVFALLLHDSLNGRRLGWRSVV